MKKIKVEPDYNILGCKSKMMCKENQNTSVALKIWLEFTLPKFSSWEFALLALSSFESVEVFFLLR